jgi:PAS domain S-box-containing protein
VGVLLFDVATGTLLQANDGFLQMTGYTREQVLSRALTWRTMTPPEYVAESEAQMEALRATGRIWPYEKEYCRADGSRFWMLFTGTALGDGTVVEYCIDVGDRKRAEAEVRASEAKYRTLFEAIDEGFVLFDMIYDADGAPVDFRYVETNPAFERQAGRQPAPGQTMRELFPEAQDMWLAEYAEVARTGRQKRFVHRIAELDRWYDVYVFPALGPPGRLAALFRDVTSEKQAEEALRQSEQRLAAELSSARVLQRLSTSLIPEQGPDALHEQVLEAAMQVMGADAASLQMLEPDGCRLVLLASRNLHPESEAYWRIVDASGGSSCARFLASHNRKIIEDVEAAKGPEPTRDLEAFRRSGIRAVQSTPLVSRSGTIVGAISTHWREPRRFSGQDFRLFDVLVRQAADVLERRRAQEALSQSEQRFRLLVDNVHEYALFQTDPEGKITSWNPGAERLFGYTSAEIMAQDVSCLLTPEDQKAGILHREIARVMQGQQTQDARWLVRRDRSRFWAQWVTEPVRDESGKLRGVAKILRDETERRKSDEMIRKSLAEKEALLREVHHRVKNNLQVITSLLNLQAQQLESKAVLTLFEETRNRVQSIASIHELLYRSEHVAAIDIIAYARQLAPDLVRFYGLEHRIEVEVAGGNVTLDLERAVPYGLLLNELVTNACKHAFPPSQKGRIRLLFRRDADQIELTVSDDGKGLPANFDFRRSDSLGLKLVRGLTRQLRGTVECVPGNETSVRVRFPLQGLPGER